MPTTTFFADASSGTISSHNAAYAPSARNGTNLAVAVGPSDDVGQQFQGGVYWIFEGFLAFDTSSLPDGATISSAVLSVYVNLDGTTTDFTVEARLDDWGSSLTTGDWVAGSSLSGLTSLATLATSGISANAYNAFTNVAMPANINKTGFTRFVLSSSATRTNTAPTTNDLFQYDSASGTNPPKLVVTYETAPTLTLSSPADASFATTTTPTLTALVTDPDSTETETVTFDVATDSGFVSIVSTVTNTTTSPAAGTPVSQVVGTALTPGTTYYWRAKVSDGTQTSSYTAARSFTVYANPTVSVTLPVEASSVVGGPNITVTWTYSQAQSLAQATYRVRLQNDAGSTTYYDSGTLTGTAVTLTFDAVANGVPTDTTDIKAVVDVTSAATGFAGTDSNGFDLLWGVVTTAITSPADGTVTADSTPDITFTFASTRSKTMLSYRVVVTIAAIGSTFYDSGWTTSTTSPLTVTLPVLSDNTRYTVTVTHRNSEGVSS